MVFSNNFQEIRKWLPGRPYMALLGAFSVNIQSKSIAVHDDYFPTEMTLGWQCGKPFSIIWKWPYIFLYIVIWEPWDFRCSISYLHGEKACPQILQLVLQEPARLSLILQELRLSTMYLRWVAVFFFGLTSVGRGQLGQEESLLEEGCFSDDRLSIPKRSFMPQTCS